MEALGMIEVRGFLGAVVVADSALKAANVHLATSQRIKGGITTVVLTGDVGAVKAAVEAGVQSGKELGTYRAHHVIPRPDSQTDILFSRQKKPVEKSVDEENTATENVDIEEAPVETTKAPIDEPKVEEKSNLESNSYSKESLEKMRVVELRKLALKLGNTSLSSKEIKFANKAVLIDAILNSSKKEEI